MTFLKLVSCIVRYKKVFNSHKKNIKPNSKILFNHFSISQINDHKFKSKYWGDLPNIINKTSDLVWLNMLHSDFKNCKLNDINEFIEKIKVSKTNIISL